MPPHTERLDRAASEELHPPARKPADDVSETTERADAVGHDDQDDHGIDHLELGRIMLVAVAVVISWLHLWRPIAAFDAVAWGATVIGGYPILKEAVSALFARRMTMELSMTIALGAALAINEAFTALVIVLFVLVAEVLEHLTVDRGRKAIRDLMAFLPRTVSVRRGHDTEELAASALNRGDVVVVKPGARVPVDGEVASGHSFVDQAMVTGESLPVEKTSGSKVFAGTINQSGVLDIRATGVGRDTAYARIIEAVERAEETRAPVQKTADRLAGYLVYFALGAAALTLLLTHNARATISVIIVAGACGIAAGTPLAILGAIGRAARLGSIIKGGIHLESLGHIDTVVLDKTGTLTLGTPEVVRVHSAAGVLLPDLLRAAATAESASEHPLAKAVLNRARAEGVAPGAATDFAYTPGRGILCSSGGETIIVGNLALMHDHGFRPEPSFASCNIHVAASRKYLGALEVADVIRPQAKEAIAQLKAMGLHLVMLTGDAASVAENVGAELGVENVLADLLPEQKTAEIERLQASGRRVAMVGDGINDAPALAQADVGIGMGSGAEIAREAADVVLLGNDLMKLVATLSIARRCRAIIRQNFVGTLVVDGVGVLLAALNILNPLLAAFIHVASELTFILNSTRLLPGRPPLPRCATWPASVAQESTHRSVRFAYHRASLRRPRRERVTMPEEDLETTELKERVAEVVDRAVEARSGPRWMTYLSLSTALIAVFAAVASLQSGANSNDAILEKNEAVLNQSKASDQWAYYQAKAVKAELAANAAEMASDAHPGVVGRLRDDASRYKLEQDVIQKLARDLENQVVANNERAAHLLERHHRFALSVTLFQIAIALSAIAALTRQKPLWFVALAAAAAALVVFAAGQVI